jgi:hypothetical protein
LKRPPGKWLILEGEQDREPRVEWIDEALILERRNRLLEVDVWLTKALITELLHGGLAVRVDDVKHVKRDLELQPLG